MWRACVVEEAGAAQRGRGLAEEDSGAGGGGWCSAERTGAGGGSWCSLERTRWAHSSSQTGQEQLQGPVSTQELAGQDQGGPEPGGGGAQPRAWVLSEHKEGKRCQHPWGLGAAKANRGGGMADTAGGWGEDGVSSHGHHQEPVRGAEAPPDEGQRGERRPRLQAQHSENEDHGIRSRHFMASRWGNSGNGGRL